MHDSGLLHKADNESPSTALHGGIVATEQVEGCDSGALSKKGGRICFLEWSILIETVWTSSEHRSSSASGMRRRCRRETLFS